MHFRPPIIIILCSFYLFPLSTADPPPCYNGGYLSEDNRTCICPKYFDRVDSECLYCLCPNCRETGTNYCPCAPGWQGRFCEDVDCGSQGVLDPENNKTCVCNPGYSGKTCRKTNCRNGDRKTTYHGYYEIAGCDCWLDWEGEFCQLIICYNHGLRGPDNESCLCADEYFGTNCEIAREIRIEKVDSSSNDTLYIIFAISLACTVCGCCCYMCRKWALEDDDYDGEPVPLATRIARRITSSDSAGPRGRNARFESDPLANATASRESEDGPPRYSTEVEGNGSRGQILNESDELPPPSYDEAIAMK